jgi:hypothetical protein
MGRKCVIRGCLSTRASLHSFPDRYADPARFAAWVKFVQMRRSDWSGPASSRTSVCREHFTPDCFNNGLLSKTAIPTVNPWSWEHDGDEDAHHATSPQSNAPNIDEGVLLSIILFN